MKPSVQIKRAYDEPGPEDGLRVLIDRLWPRGISKENLKHDLWLKDLAPSTELRQWFGHKPERWDEFRQKYTDELKSEQSRGYIDKIFSAAGGRGITLVYGAHDTEHNQAVVLADFMRNNAPRSNSG